MVRELLITQSPVEVTVPAPLSISRSKKVWALTSAAVAVSRITVLLLAVKPVVVKYPPMLMVSDAAACKAPDPVTLLFTSRS